MISRFRYKKERERGKQKHVLLTGNPFLLGNGGFVPFHVRTVELSSHFSFVPGGFPPLEVSSREVSSHIYVCIRNFKV